MTGEQADALQADVVREIEAAIAFARSSPEPEVDTLMEDIYA